ncbi:MAG: MerR family DNA-binding transcriptional regulator [Patescibacteria group bacterium]
MSFGRKYLSIKQASAVIGVTPLTLRNWDRDGKLSPYRNPINNYRYYRVDQIEAFLRVMESSRDRYRKIKIADIS